MADTTPVETPRPRRSKWVLPAAAGIVVVALAAGGAFLFWQRSRAAASPAAADRPAPAPSGVVSLEPFLVNLADPQAQRFARVTVRLVVDTKEVVDALAADPVKQARLRSTVLEALAAQTADRLVTPDGKVELKKAIAERGTGVLGHQVRDVLFTDFVVQ